MNAYSKHVSGWVFGIAGFHNKYLPFSSTGCSPSLPCLGTEFHCCFSDMVLPQSSLRDYNLLHHRIQYEWYCYTNHTNTWKSNYKLHRGWT